MASVITTLAPAFRSRRLWPLNASTNMFTVSYRVQCTLFYIENDAEIFPAHYTWKVAEKGFKIAFMMNKLAMNISSEIILEI